MSSDRSAARLGLRVCIVGSRLRKLKYYYIHSAMLDFFCTEHSGRETRTNIKPNLR